jgi:hypothetical protein
MKVPAEANPCLIPDKAPAVTAIITNDAADQAVGHVNSNMQKLQIILMKLSCSANSYQYICIISIRVRQ